MGTVANSGYCQLAMLIRNLTVTRQKTTLTGHDGGGFDMNIGVYDLADKFYIDRFSKITARGNPVINKE